MTESLQKENKPKWILVTGAAKRIGEAIAWALHKAGYAVILHYNHSEKLALELKNTIINDNGKAVTVKANFNNSKDIKNLIKLCNKYHWWGLVNNASYFANDFADKINLAMFDELISINIKAPQLLSEALYKQEGRKIIHIIDSNVHLLKPPFYSYNITKVALSAMLKMQSLTFSPITCVNGIAPGLVLQSNWQTKEKFNNLHSQNPLNLGVTIHDITRAILFIINSPTMTGQLITIDSGQTVGHEKPSL